MQQILVSGLNFMYIYEENATENLSSQQSNLASYEIGM